MKIQLETRGRPAQRIDVAENDIGSIREAMFEFQKYTEAVDIVAVDGDTGERIARLQFTWLDGDSA